MVRYLNKFMYVSIKNMHIDYGTFIFDLKSDHLTAVQVIIHIESFNCSFFFIIIAFFKATSAVLHKFNVKRTYPHRMNVTIRWFALGHLQCSNT